MTAENLTIDAVPWLRDVPEHWMRQRLKYLVHFVSGGTPDTAKLDYWGGSIPWVSPKDMKSLRLNDAQDHITESALLESATAAVSEGTPLLVVRSGILRHTIPVAITGKRMAINQDIKGLVPKNGQIHPEYFARFVEGHNAELLREWRKEGTTVESLELPLVTNFEMVLPPLDEQRAIVRFLDRETARIDALIEKKRRQIELLQEKRAALISHAVTKGLDPNAPMKDSGIEWLGDVPAHWEIRRLKRIARLRSGESIIAEAIDHDGEYPVYGGNGLRGYTSSFTHEGEHVLIGRQGALCGCINYGSGCFWASEHAVVVTPVIETRIRWLGELLRTMDLNQHSQSAAQPGLAVETIAALNLPVPPFCDQVEIAAFLDRETARIDALADKVNLSIDRLREYRTALISAAVTGKIDVRGK